MEKRKALTATLTPFRKKKVLYLQAYYKRGARWYKVKKVKGL